LRQAELVLNSPLLVRIEWVCHVSRSAP